MLRGIDISHGQGEIDWDKLAPALDFVFIKATQGPGPQWNNGPVAKKSFADSRFKGYRAKAESKNLIRGYYHFAIPNYVPYHAALDAAGGKPVSPSDYQSDAAEQANFFCDTVGALAPGELDLVLDLEATKYGHGGHDLTDDDLHELQDWTQTFVDTVKTRYPGRTVILYSYSAFFKAMGTTAAPFPKSLLTCPLWLAQLANGGTESPPKESTEWEAWAGKKPTPPHWPAFSFWQFSWKSHPPGMPSEKTEVDADLFDGTMAELRRLAHLDQVIYPLDATAEEHFALNEGGEGGFYPVGANNFWHGGIHLDTDGALQAVADGTLVAYRATKKPADVELGGAKHPLSPGFALTHHTRYTPKGAKIDFFVLYMHLCPLDDYTDAQKEKPPPLFSKPKFFVATDEDGAGLGVSSAADQGTIVGVIPKGAHFEVVPKEKATWSASAKKVRWGSVEGFAVITGKATLVAGSTYKCVTGETAPDASKLGLNVRENGAGTKVTRVAPNGSVLEFKDPNALIKGGKLVSGWYPLKAGGSVCVRTGDSPSVRMTMTLEGAQLDKVVKVDKPVSTGIVLGYPGPYFTHPQTVHVEIFTNDVGFMKNPKADKGGPTTLKVPPGTVFKKKTDLEDELIQIDAPAEARLRVVKKGDPWVQVAVDEIVGWTTRDSLGDYDSGTGKYTLKEALESITLESTEGEPYAINAQPGAKLRYQKLQEGDYRKVGYLLTSAERDQRTGWAHKSEIGKWKGAIERYILAAPLATLHKNKPDCLFEFKEDAGKNAEEAMIDLLVAPDPGVAKDANGKTWQEGEFAPGQKGWFQPDAKNIKSICAYDWPRWQRVEEHGGYSDDGLCDAGEIISIIDEDGDGSLTSTEIKDALSKPHLADKFRHLAGRHPTEWSGELKGLDRLAGPPWNLAKKDVDATKAYIKKLGFWTDLAGAGLPAKDTVWHVHPIGFLRHLRSLTLSPTAPLPATAGAPNKAEVFLLCDHKIDGNPRCVRDKTGRFEIVASVDKKKDHVTVLHKDSMNPSPEALAIAFPGGKLEAKSEGIEGDDYTKYGFDAEHKGPDNFNIISSEYWKALFGPTTYTIQNLPKPIQVAAYPPHKWKLGIKFPTMRALKVGSKLENQSMAAAGPGFLAAAQKSKNTVEIEKTGWQTPKVTTTAETTKTSGVLVTPNKVTAVSQYSQSIQTTIEEPEGHVVEAITLSRDDKKISLKEVPTLKALFSIVEIANDIMGVIRAIQDNVPKVGWYAEFNLQVLEGKLGLEWQWKEHKDHRAFLWFKAGIEISLFSVSLEIGVGVSGCGFKAQVFAKVTGSVDVGLNAERVSPDAWDVLQIPLKVSITGAIGARFEVGHYVNVEAVLETALEVEGIVKLNTGHGLSASLTFKWTGLKGSVTASIGKGGSLGSYSGEQEFISEVELGKTEWPSEEPYNPEFVTRARIKEILEEAITGWWSGLQVYTGDTRWTDEKVIERLTTKIDSRGDIRRDGKSVEGLVKDIRQHLEGMQKEAFWRGDYIEGAAFERFLAPSGELDRMMTTTYIDPCKEMLNRLGK